MVLRLQVPEHSKMLHDGFLSPGQARCENVPYDRVLITVWARYTIDHPVENRKRVIDHY